MPKTIRRALLLAALSFTAGCAAIAPPPPQTQSSPPPVSITAPINKANQARTDVQQKAMEREQLNPESQPETTPSP